MYSSNYDFIAGLKKNRDFSTYLDYPPSQEGTAKGKFPS
jgi:hypothetical protein